MTPTLAALVLYMLVQFGIGIWVSRRIVTEDDYLVAGRRLGYPLATFSIFATWFGAETTIGAAGAAYRDGVSLGSAEPFGYGLCLVLMGLVFAAPLWRRRLTTLADLFRDRYSPLVERVAAVILVPASILWAAAQIRAFGQILATTTTAIDIDTAIAVAAGFTLLYTVFGGLLADAITDLVQGVLLVLGLVLLSAVVVHHVGGLEAFADAALGSGRVRLAASPGVPWLETLEAWAIPICGSVIATELVGRVIAARSPQVARRSSLLAGAMYIAIGILPVALGVVGVQILDGLGDAERILPTLARELLPTFGYALFAGALVSAILSTVDSTLLVSSGLLSHNLVVPIAGITSDRAKIRVARIGVLVFGLLAFVLARRAEGVYALVEQASALGSAGTLVAVCFGLFTRFGGAPTALVTLVAGTAVYLVATASGATAPFLVSLAAAFGTYVAGGALELALRGQRAYGAGAAEAGDGG
ncbi:MAG TPA: sodium:solute symporter family protein [Gemmatimonadaceae bacterium]